VVSAQLFKADETQAIYERITAPTLCVVASSDSIQQWWTDHYSLSEFMQRTQAIRHITHATMDDVGHMLHHDQPEQLAQLIENFLATPR
jgi:pimeloyl-ACP methyl ester carboxylesterase